ncbi:MAG TPA: alpha/beta hydrolase, partial [Kofleriaceae bacterium]|nr:alpha/beta hydrolase [Kofleriaceae bacterium]
MWRLAIAIAMVLAGCARPSMPARPLTSPPRAPEGVVHRAGLFRSADGLDLFEQCWRPADRRAQAVVVVVHGIKDHSGRYHHLAVRLVRAGYAVCGFDHRGHGRSAGPRFAISSFDAVLGDMDRYLAIVRRRYPDTPVFLLGHSMGAVLVPLYVIDRQPALAGVILSATALRPRIHPIEIAALKLAATLFPNAPLLAAPGDTFSPDPEVVADMGRDPLIYHGRGTGQMALELAAGIRRVWAHATAIKLPILILHGTGDKAVNPRGSVELHARIGSRDKTLRLYPHAGHDLAHDPHRAAVEA